MADRHDERAFEEVLSKELARVESLVSLTARSKPRGGEPARRCVVRVWGQPGARKATLTRFEDKRQTGQETIEAGRLPEKAGELVRAFASWELSATDGDLHARRAKRAILATRGKPAAERAPSREHDRTKAHLLDPRDPGAARLLRALGLVGSSGHVLAGREKKLRQVETFVRLVIESLGETAPGESDELRILDAGCGAAYLTFALHHVLARSRPGKVRVLGVDVRPDVIRMAEATARELGVAGEVRFEVARIRDATVGEPPHVVLSLHACDTATDEALARGVALEARSILAAPCCQHELHKKLESAPLSPLLRHGILRERLADLATDGLRALILRGVGYRTDVIEFVHPEATAKNLLLRAVRTGAPREARWGEELGRLKAALGLEGPVALEELLGPGEVAAG